MPQFCAIITIRECETGDEVFKALVGTESETISAGIAQLADGIRLSLIEGHSAHLDLETAEREMAEELTKAAMAKAKGGA